VLWAQAASDEALRAASYGGRGRDLLVETPYGELPGMFEDLLFRIRVRGFRILLAHPERNPSFQQDPERLVRLVEGDTLVQVTASSVTGSGRAGKLARRLIADGHAHVIAGDLHRAGGNRSSIADAVSTVDSDRARWMVTEAPAAILAGLPLPPTPVEEARRRGWLRRR
jgi:protein-tyrosine phosphatase